MGRPCCAVFSIHHELSANYVGPFIKGQELHDFDSVLGLALAT